MVVLHRSGRYRSSAWPTSPLREAPSLAVLITAIGVSYLLQKVAQLAWTSNPKSFTSVVSGLQPISLFGGQLTIVGR